MTTTSANSQPDADTSTLELLDTFHRTMQQQLGIMLDLVQTIHRGYSLSDQQCELLADLTAWFNLQARQHHIDKECNLLPELKQSENTQIRETAEQLMQNHRWIEKRWGDLEPALSGLATRQSWMNVDDVLTAVADLYQLCNDHMLLQETVTHPAASSLLRADNCAQIMNEMHQRRTRWQ